MDRAALQTYGTQQVMTASPVKLIALLYDKAIVSLREAIRAIDEGKIEQRWKANRKATDIVTHLSNTLDHNAGGGVSENLAQLYEFMLARLFEVDRSNDRQAAQEVIGLLTPLRDSWHQLAEQGTDDKGQAQAPHASSRAEPAQPAGGNHAAPLRTVNVSA